MGTRAPWAIRHELPGESDEQLTDRAREGDQSAFGELYRRHRKAAESTAWCLLRSKNDADDVVADAFAGVLSALRNGRGPRDNFRRYLLACVRNGCRVRRSPCVPMNEPSMDRLAPVLEEPERYVEADTVARAFAALTPRWQHTLWLTEVEQRPAHEVSERMHLSPNATAALAHRARQAFATAYLAEHVGTLRSRDCVAHASQLAPYVRGALSDAAEAALEHHLVTCRGCAVAAAELRDVNASLRSIALPGQLLAAGVAATSGAATTATATVATGTTATATVATATATSGAWAALSGAGVLVKAFVAVLLVAPAITGGAPNVTAATTRESAEGVAADANPDHARPIEAPPVATAVGPAPSREVAIATDDVDEAAPQEPATGIVEALPTPVQPAAEDLIDDLVDDRIDERVDVVVDAVVEPVDIIGPVVDDILEPVLGGVVEPIVQGLDEAMAMMGLGPTGQTVLLLQSVVPLLDGPLLDMVVTDLLAIRPASEANPPGLTSLFTELQGTDGSASATSQPVAHATGTSPTPAQTSSPLPVATSPAATLPPAMVSAIILPDLTSVVIPEVAVDLPPVVILDITVIDLPGVELPALDLPALDLPALDLAGLGIPSLTPPASSQ